MLLLAVLLANCCKCYSETLSVNARKHWRTAVRLHILSVEAEPEGVLPQVSGLVALRGSVMENLTTIVGLIFASMLGPVAGVLLFVLMEAR
jgi:hypothetical protein